MRNEPLSEVLLWQRILLWSACALPCLSYGAPGGTLFSDNFERASLAPWTTTGVNVSGILVGGQVADSRRLHSQSPRHDNKPFGGTVEVTSGIIDTSDLSFSDVSMWIRRGADAFSEDPDNIENLVVEFFNVGGGWTVLETFIGDGTQGQIFPRTFNIPATGRYAGFRLRFRQTSGSGAGWDFWHIDDVCINRMLRPDLLVTKSVQTVSDPINGSSNPKAIPGAIMLYTINVSNQGLGPVDGGSTMITDIVPADSALFVDTGSGDPIVFTDGTVASGLTYDFASDVIFSNQPGGGAPFDYTPIRDAQGYDSAVTGYRINPTGSMNAAMGGSFPTFNILLTVRVQ